MTVGVPPDIVVKLFLFLVSSMSQVYLICHYGQLVADAVSLTLWSFLYFIRLLFSELRIFGCHLQSEVV